MNEFLEKNIRIFRPWFTLFHSLTFHCGHLPFLVYVVIFNITKLLIFCSMLITFDITWNKQVYVVCYKKKKKTNTINTSNHAIEIFLRII